MNGGCIVSWVIRSCLVARGIKRLCNMLDLVLGCLILFSNSLYRGWNQIIGLHLKTTVWVGRLWLGDLVSFRSGNTEEKHLGQRAGKRAESSTSKTKPGEDSPMFNTHTRLCIRLRHPPPTHSRTHNINCMYSTVTIKSIQIREMLNSNQMGLCVWWEKERSTERDKQGKKTEWVLDIYMSPPSNESH